MNWTEHMPEEDYPKMERRILGCDTCQQVCPKNDLIKKVPPPSDILSCMRIEDLLTDDGIERLDKTIKFMPGSKHKIKQQAIFAAVYTDRKDLLPLIEPLKKSDDEILAKIAAWAVDRLQ